jgi:DNA-binding winged helix-turn-helix (wHTH) protein
MIYIFGDYTLNHDLYELRYKAERIHLEPHVFEVLAYLVQHSDRVVSKHELFEHLWPQRYVSDKALVRCIQKARHAIQDHHGKPQLIQTIYGRGYRFVGVVRQYAQSPLVGERSLGPHALATLAQSPGHHTTSHVATPQATWPFLNGASDGERKQVTVLVGVLDNAAGLAAQCGDETMHRVMQEFLGLA